jgi:hypothetical protein
MAEHLLIQCVFAREVWYLWRIALGVHFELPSEDSLFQEWWLLERARFSKVDRTWFDGMVRIVGHSLWKNHNAWCFNNVQRQSTARRLSANILEQFHHLELRMGSE